MTPTEIKAVLTEHAKWLANPKTGKRADLRGANLRGADLRRADLGGANLRGAYLRGADLRGADLRRAYLRGAYLRGADLRDAYLRGADLRDADLGSADLGGANLGGADLRGAYLEGADLRDADLEGAVLPEITHVPKTGALTVYKKVAGGAVLELEIPDGVPRTGSLIGRKCRAKSARVVRVAGDIDPAVTEFRSQHDPEFVYVVGQTVTVESYSDDIRVECAPGIHFFMTEEEARAY